MNPKLIPRFNLDYGIPDLYCGVTSIFKKNLDHVPLTFIFGKKRFYFTNSGRTSIYVVLRALNLPKNSKIGTPLYSCPSVFEAIIQAGHKPCFLDINFENYTLDLKDLEKKIDDIKALVVIHTFGRPAEMDEILNITGNIPIIEDCAHSMLSGYKGRATGTLGDAAIFSFRSGKYISAGEGGMIILNNGEIEEGIEREIGILPEYSASNELQHLCFVYLKSLLYHRPWYGMFAKTVGERLDDKMNISGKKGFKAAKIRKSDLSVFLKKLSVFKGLVEKQRKNSKLLLRELENAGLTLPYEAENTYCNYYLFPVLFDSKEKRDFAYNYLKKHNIDAAKLFSETPDRARLHYGYEGNCPKTEEISRRILTVPNYYTLTEQEIRRIADLVREAVM
jgi:dTDP-4-amino-4,6-dideoxygalactose transaminase